MNETSHKVYYGQPFDQMGDPGISMAGESQNCTALNIDCPVPDHARPGSWLGCAASMRA